MNRNNIITILSALLLLPFLAACDYVAEGDQLIEVALPEPPGSVTKKVLLEDFTGQRCVNCPKGTEVIEQLQQAYGDRVIAVGIHSGPLGFKGNATTVGLATDLGDTYYNHWNLEYQPVGLIDRGTATNYTDWITSVRQQLNQQATTRIEVQAAVNGSNIEITVQEEQQDAAFSGKLQIWVLEDGITALQLMPDGSSNRNYVHNHVLRTAVNGTWGEELTLAKGESRTQNYVQPLDASWNKTQLSIVAFVYNDSGVMQAEKVKVKD